MKTAEKKTEALEQAKNKISVLKTILICINLHGFLFYAFLLLFLHNRHMCKTIKEICIFLILKKLIAQFFFECCKAKLESKLLKNVFKLQ